METITKENSVESKNVHYGDSNVVNKFNLIYFIFIFCILTTLSLGTFFEAVSYKLFFLVHRSLKKNALRALKSRMLGIDKVRR